jgi:hypothetical protein
MHKTTGKHPDNVPFSSLLKPASVAARHATTTTPAMPIPPITAYIEYNMRINALIECVYVCLSLSRVLYATCDDDDAGNAHTSHNSIL